MDDKELYQALISSTGTSNALATLLQATYSDLRTDMRGLEERLRGVEHEFDDKLEGLKTQLDELLLQKTFRERAVRLVEYIAIVGVSIFGAWDWIEAHILSKIR